MNTQRSFVILLTFLSFLTMSFVLLEQKPKAKEKRHVVEIRTELGTVVVELYNETPQHRDNFLKLVKEGFYDSLLWHRVIPQFMVQGGDPQSKHAIAGAALGQGGPGYTVPAEIVPGLIHKRGALAAARQGDQVNPTKASSGSQFYIVQGRSYTPEEMKMLTDRNVRMGGGVTYNEEQLKVYTTLGGAPHLDGAYTIFGEVVSGMEVIDLLASQQCDQMNRPRADVHMWMKETK